MSSIAANIPGLNYIWGNNNSTNNITVELTFQNAIISGDTTTIKQLAGEVPLSKPLPNGELPLNFAVQKNLPEVVKFLLAAGANATLRDDQQFNAVDYAALAKNE